MFETAIKIIGYVTTVIRALMLVIDVAKKLKKDIKKATAPTKVELLF